MQFNSIASIVGISFSTEIEAVFQVGALIHCVYCLITLV